MKEQKLNHLAIWASILLQFVIGFLWYGPLFGEAWMSMVGLDMATMQSQPMEAGPWIMNAIASVSAIYLLAWLFLKMKIDSLMKGCLYGFLIGFVFVQLSEMTGGGFANYPYWLAWITGGFSTVGLAVSGAVLGAWRKYAL